jgi:hypothetical protein
MSDTCTWTQDSDCEHESCWHTECGCEAWVGMESYECQPSQHKMNFCWYCGKRLYEVPYVPEPEVEE